MKENLLYFLLSIFTIQACCKEYYVKRETFKYDSSESEKVVHHHNFKNSKSDEKGMKKLEKSRGKSVKIILKKFKRIV